MTITIESGDWCRIYNDFITRVVVDKCPRYKDPGFKGCAGSKCEHMASAIKINGIVRII